ncbi:MAG TPA: UbiA-like protein EboC [Cytophagaceae bacterium]|jgi:4-hydroxybenzoate polyprenyltransferase
MSKVLAYLRLTRPANIITALADIFAGFAISGLVFYPFELKHLELMNWSILGQLLVSTACLYGGGIVFNDFFDRKLDAIERPERPIPSKNASAVGAATLGTILLLAGIFFSFNVSLFSGIIAIAISMASILYDAISKHHIWLGPFNMGLCRALNLLLGVSALPEALGAYSYMAIIPLLYIFAITLISKGEVTGGNKKAIAISAFFYGLVTLGILIAIVYGPGKFSYSSLAILLMFVIIIYRPLLKAYKIPEARNIRTAVKTGVISLIIMDACIGAAFAGGTYGLLTILLLPISIGLAKIFSVT